MNAAALLAAARALGATILESPGATVIVVPTGSATAKASAVDLVPIGEAARIAATSLRVVRDAIRAGDLAAFGGQRDRAIRRADLDAWIASRRLRPVAGVADADIERRMRRLAESTPRKANAPAAVAGEAGRSRRGTDEGYIET